MEKKTPTRYLSTVLPGALLAGLVILSACAARPADESFVVADLFATPGKSLATLALSPTPEPTATLPNFPTSTPAPTLPLPTAILFGQPTLPLGPVGATPTRDATAIAVLTRTPCSPPPPPFVIAWDRQEQARLLLGCPIGGPEVVSSVYQSFEHGVMFWVRDTTDIYVLSELAITQGQPSDTWWRFGNLNTADQPDFDPNIIPPEGLRQPVRGFGYVWRNNAFVRDAVGWATIDEAAFDSLWMRFENGWMMTGLDGGLGAPVYVLIPLDPPQNTTGLHFGGVTP